MLVAVLFAAVLVAIATTIAFHASYIYAKVKTE